MNKKIVILSDNLIDAEGNKIFQAGIPYEVIRGEIINEEHIEILLNDIWVDFEVKWLAIHECKICKKTISEGYYHEPNNVVYCSKSCLDKDISEKEYEKLNNDWICYYKRFTVVRHTGDFEDEINDYLKFRAERIRRNR